MSEYKTVRDFGANTERLIGYFYSGLSAVLVIAILEPQKIRSLIETLGTPISIITAVALGIGMYSIYFHIVGELFLFQMQRFFHYLSDLFRGFRGNRQTSTTGYIGFLGVPFLLRRRAYESLKNEFINEELKSEIYLAHGELSVLYISATYSIAAMLYSISSGLEYFFWLYAGSVFLTGAIIVDISQHSKESQIFKLRSESDLKEFLSKKGFLAV